MNFALRQARLAVVAASACLAAAPTLAAQARDLDPRAPTSLIFGIGYLRGFSRGTLGAAIGDLDGVGGYLVYPLMRRGIVSARFDVGIGSPPEETIMAPVAGGAQLEVTTTSSVTYTGLGPQFNFSVGPLRPYVHAGAGITRLVYDLFAAVQSGGVIGSATGSNTQTTFGWLAGAGFRLPLIRGGGVVSLDAQAEYIGGASIDLPVRGSLAIDSTGTLTVGTTRGRVQVLGARVGIAVTF